MKIKIGTTLINTDFISHIFKSDIDIRTFTAKETDTDKSEKIKDACITICLCGIEYFTLCNDESEFDKFDKLYQQFESEVVGL